MAIGSNINELNREADPIARFHHRPLYQAVDTQATPHLRSRLLGTRARSGRRMGTHPERIDLGKVRREFVSHAVCEKLLAWVGGKTCERENGDRLDWMRAK